MSRGVVPCPESLPAPGASTNTNVPGIEAANGAKPTTKIDRASPAIAPIIQSVFVRFSMYFFESPLMWRVRAQLPAIRQHEKTQKALVRSIFGRAERNCDLISRFQNISGPAIPGQLARTKCF